MLLPNELPLGLTIGKLVELAHENAVAKGFWNDSDAYGDSGFAVRCALVHSEVSEALEADRNTIVDSGAAVEAWTAAVGEELADIVIRVADMAGGYCIDLEAEIAKKVAINAKRPAMHGKKY